NIGAKMLITVVNEPALSTAHSKHRMTNVRVVFRQGPPNSLSASGNQNCGTWPQGISPYRGRSRHRRPAYRPCGTGAARVTCCLHPPTPPSCPVCVGFLLLERPPDSRK